MIGYLGKEGSYSYLAASSFYVKEDLMPYRNIARLFYALEHDEVTGIVVPFESFKYGTSFDILGRIQQYNYHITREIVLDVELVLISTSYDIKSIHTLYATFESFDEAYDTVKSNLGRPTKDVCATNREALSRLEHDTTNQAGAIVSKYDPMDAFHVVAHDIRDDGHNTMKYVLIEKQLAVTGFHNRTVIAVCPNTKGSGSLYDLLHELVLRKIDIVKVLTLPTTVSQPLVFYFEVVGNLEDDALKDAFAMLKLKSNSTAILGSYHTKDEKKPE